MKIFSIGMWVKSFSRSVPRAPANLFVAIDSLTTWGRVTRLFRAPTCPTLSETETDNTEPTRKSTSLFQACQPRDNCTNFEVFDAIAPQNGYRSDDWYFMSDIRADDFVAGGTRCECYPAFGSVKKVSRFG